jgi:hypothetical protein
MTKAELLEAVKREPSPVRRVVQTRATHGLIVATLVSCFIFVAAGGLHATVRPPVLVATTAALSTAVAGIATWLALYRGPSMLGAPRAWLVGVAVLLPLALGLAWLAGSGSVPMSAPHGWDADATCFVVTVAMATTPLVVLIAVRREGDPVMPEAIGGIAGAAAGAWGALLIDLHCERNDLPHVVLGHLLPVVVLALVGAVAARSALAIRART